MAISLSPLFTPFFLLFLLLSTSPTHSYSSNPSNTTTKFNPQTLNSICSATPYPNTCLSSMKLSISIPLTLQANILSLALRSLHSALSSASSLSPTLSAASHSPYLIQTQQSSVQDCIDLHASTLSSLSRSASLLHSNSPNNYLPDVRAHLSASLTNKVTCLEGLSGAHGPLKQSIVSSLLSAYEPVSNSLALVSKSSSRAPGRKLGRRMTDSGFPEWLSRRDRRLLQSSVNDYDDDSGHRPSSVISVAKDGSGNFTTISDAIAFAPSNSDDRIIIWVRAGVYEENVDVASYKTNIVLLGDGSDSTVITAARSVGDGWTTFRSATVAVSGQGFLARDITFRNTAGPTKGQAVALRVNADLTAVYHCTIDGYQDTLYVHSFRQFYRECDIYGTVDFIFGNAAVIFQGCNMVARNPVPGQSNVVTAQSRDDPNEDTGISIQNCSVVASQDLALSDIGTKTYLGRPWRSYSRTVYIESYLDGLINSAGWTEWPGGQGLDTLYYGEYMNSGPGSVTDGRVTWPGYHVMGYDDASYFSASNFIYGDDWLGSTAFPYDDGI